MSYAFSFKSSALPDELRLCGFTGSEALSTPYRFDVYFVLKSDAELDLADVVGAKGTLEMITKEGDPAYCWHGLLTNVRLLNRQPHGTLYHAALVPKLWLLTQTRHSRLFTHQSIVDTIKEVLEDSGLTSDDYELRLDRDYEVEEHVCQFHESNLDFIQRWMEAEGMYYFFEHGDDAEKLIITDHKSFHEDLLEEPIAYHTGASERVARRSAKSFTCEHLALPASVELADYDYGNPNLDLSSKAEVSSIGMGEISAHAQRFFGEGQAQQYAAIRAEELSCREVQYELQGAVTHLRSGYLCELDSHPRSSFNTKYLVTALRHRAGNNGWTPDGEKNDEIYTVEAEAIQADTQFRPRRVTAWPHIYGFEGAVVDGEATSDYAQLDDAGRYLIHFFFDEATLGDGKASTRVRMAQPHGGNVEGWHFPLRKGTEVVVAFQGGDPDRPVIVGVAPNAETVSPVTSANHTTNVVQTGGRNRMEMEDKDGGQRFTTSSPTEDTFLRMGAPNDDFNCKLHTTGNGYIKIGRDLSVTIGGPKQEWVGGTTTETYEGTMSTTVDEATTEKFMHDKKETVDQALTEIYEATQNETVEGDLKEVYGSHTTVVHGRRFEDSDQSVTETYLGPVGTTVTNQVTENYDANYTLGVTGAHTQTVSGRYYRTVGDHDHKNKKESCLSMGAHVKFTLGATSETIIGSKTEILLAIKGETMVGVKLEMMSSCLIELFGVEKTLVPLGTDSDAYKNSALGAKMQSTGAAVVKIAAGARNRIATLLARN